MEASSPAKAVSAELHELPDLLFERHLVQQCVQLNVFHLKAFLAEVQTISRAESGSRRQEPPAARAWGSYSVSRSILSL